MVVFCIGAFTLKLNIRSAAGFSFKDFINYQLVYSPFHTGFNHITGHEFEPGLQVFAELLLRPVKISDEGLQGIQLPEEIL